MGQRISVNAVRQIAEKHEIKSPGALATAARINPNTARRWWIDDPTITRYEASIIVALCNALNVSPGDLLTLIPNGAEAAQE